MTRLSLLIDVTKCSGCHNCFLACRDEYYGNDYSPYSAPQPLDGQFWMQIKEVERGSYPKPKLDYIPIPCMHCEDAPCIDAAADGAVYRRDDGIVMIDPVKAKGQKAIVNACPYRVIFWNEALELPQKCTLCAHMLDVGEKLPRCVEACPTGALVFGDLDDPGSEIAKLSAEFKPEVYHPEYGVKPTVKYIGIPKRFVTGEVVKRDDPGECAEGVKVTLEGGDLTLETRTDSYGDFEFDGLEKNTDYRVGVELDGYASMVIEVYTQTDVDLGEIVLEPFN
ncbi:MAG: carboxypeptidase regulatory-like domain-containing protein [Thermoleophilia bacterium]|nr:carboxypeptidase regulatory-like domain-containing protein [Thermoleophilia bacterium]